MALFSNYTAFQSSSPRWRWTAVVVRPEPTGAPEKNALLLSFVRRELIPPVGSPDVKLTWSENDRVILLEAQAPTIEGHKLKGAEIFNILP